MRVPEREEKKKGTERIFEKIMTEIWFHTPSFVKGMNLHSQGSLPTLRRNVKSFTQRHIIIKQLKEKEKLLKASRERFDLLCSRDSNKTNSQFLIRNHGSQKVEQWHIKVMKEKKNYQPRILCLANYSWNMKKKIKTSWGEQKPKEFITSRHFLQVMLKGAVQTKIKIY